MKSDILRIYKNLGETPLEAIKRLVLERPEYRDLPITYAGRLDPMAEGELLILTGEECKNKEKYLAMDKEYEFKIIFGFKTDSYDLLGLSENHAVDKEEIKKNLEGYLKKSSGKIKQKYPPFSSKTIDGVPLFKKTRQGHDYELPEKEVEIYKIDFLGFEEISKENLGEEIIKRISLVKGDFRQDEIIEKWKNNLSLVKEESFLIANVSMTCSSGTYVRSFVNNLPFPATTFWIKRNRVFGKY